MKTILKHNLIRPDFVSEVVLKPRSEIKALAISGSGDPRRTFDKRLDKISEALDDKDCLHFGIFYKNRDIVGIQNVEWDACVQTNESPREKDLVKQIELPKTEVASITLNGSYALIGEAVDFMKRVLELNNIVVKLPLYEFYLKESDAPITELQYPLAQATK